MADKPKPASKPKPEVIAFAMASKMDGRFKVWHAMALRIRGREVLEERVLETDDSLQVVCDVMEKALWDFSHYDSNPFEVRG